MSKKIVLFNASPRKGGNSEFVTTYLAEKLSGNEITTFNVREKEIHPCLACAWCQGKEKAAGCMQKDDFTTVLPILDHCDAIVLATPIYYNQITAQAKMIFDRLYPFFNVDKIQMTNSPLGKKAALVCSCWGSPRDVMEKYADWTAGNFGMVGASDIKSYVFDGIPERGALKKHEDYLQKLDELAKWLKA